MRQKTTSKLIVSLIILASSWNAHAEGPMCRDVFATPLTATQILNQDLAERFPGLASMLQDPEAYYERINKEFQEQKRLTPDDPYSFDFSEFGMPLITDIQGWLKQQISELTADHIAFQNKVANRNKVSGLVLRPLDIRKDKEYSLYLKYLTELKAEADQIVADKHVTYYHVSEFSYFYSRAANRFITRNYPLRDRLLLALDRIMEGYKPLPLQEEYNLYHNRQFQVFQKNSIVKSWREAEKPFANAFDNTDQLQGIWINTNLNLDQSILQRLMNTKIHLIGISNVPIWADGYNRPSGDFRMHDVRHESFKYIEIERYIETHELTEAQLTALRAKMDEWMLELRTENAQIQDPDLKAAVNLTAFSFHHDSGFPFIPSSFLATNHFQPVRSLYMFYLVSGHGDFFNKPWKNLDLAEVWLKDFWRKRLDQETAILGIKAD